MKAIAWTLWICLVIGGGFLPLLFLGLLSHTIFHPNGNKGDFFIGCGLVIVAFSMLKVVVTSPPWKINWDCEPQNKQFKQLTSRQPYRKV